MQLNKQSLSVKGFASKDANRRALCGVLVEPDGTTVATNGRAIAVVSPAPDALVTEEAPAEFNPGEPLAAAVILPLADVAAVKLPRHKVTALQVAHLSGGNGSGAVFLARAADRDSFAPIVATVRPIDGHFPDWRQVMPADATAADLPGKRTVRVAIAADMLVALGKLAGEFTGNKLAPVELQISVSPVPLEPGEDGTVDTDAPREYERVTLDPVRFSVKDTVAGQSLAGAVMPIRPEPPKGDQVAPHVYL